MPNAANAPGVRGSREHAALLDLDGTLHRSAAFQESLGRAFVELVADSTGRSGFEIEGALVRYRESTPTRGGKRGEFEFLVQQGVPVDSWLDLAEQHTKIAANIRADEALATTLIALRKNAFVVVTTNSPWLLASTVLKALGITDLIDFVACPRHPACWIPFPETGKPSVELYRNILTALDVRPDKAVAIGDRLAVDIIPAQEMGIPALLLQPDAALVDLLEAQVRAWR